METWIDTIGQDDNGNIDPCISDLRLFSISVGEDGTRRVQYPSLDQSNIN